MDDIVRLEQAFVGFCLLAGIAFALCGFISFPQPTETTTIPCKHCAEKIKQLEAENAKLRKEASKKSDAALFLF